MRCMHSTHYPMHRYGTRLAWHHGRQVKRVPPRTGAWDTTRLGIDTRVRFGNAFRGADGGERSGRNVHPGRAELSARCSSPSPRHLSEAWESSQIAETE